MAKTVLFLCDDNSVLSPLAEAYLNALDNGAIRAFSAGLDPAPRLAPGVGRILSEHGIPAAGLEPKPWELFLLPHAPAPDVVISLAPGVVERTRRAWSPRTRTFEWPFAAGPSAGKATGSEAVREAFRSVRRAINRAHDTWLGEADGWRISA
ncbi:low molecular weight phosphatase family protein [Stappia taiwanensis]|uniref:Low molecular weight phosphatase family protein n=1 Tax=Stappia taiwanensis TaxID=992267 RepID=A0A838XP13_9HYPH|nr:low molecular weight phosphatase family protein [Stappia taiwanensis]MBA4612999.1 low molecular weight phosphatase family protein [Stappia taiwanensis]GGF02018.1 hypothetical protein GCM10007285_32080 [Stappia taiwanensis]